MITSTSKHHTPPQSKYIHLRDGLRQHILCWNQEIHQQTPCLLLHGFTNDGHIWTSLAEHLQNKHAVYAIDFRGHGDSDRDPKARYTHHTLVDDINDIVQHFGWQRFHIVGHSLGARVAALYIQRYQPELISFTIVDTGPEVGAAGVSKVRKDAEAMPAKFSSIEQYTEYLSNIYLLANRKNIELLLAKNGLKELPDGELTPKTDPAFTAALWNPQSYQNNAKDLKAPLNEQLWNALSHITAPTLILKGQISAILSRNIANKMAKQIMSNAQLSIIPRAGHAVMVDNPTEFEKQTLNFINQFK